MEGFLSGFATGFGLILAIGAQNAFVLRQGLRREHVFAVCLACALSDAVLIAAGVVGLGALLDVAPWFEPAMRYGGAAFLVWYGARNALAAWRGGQAMQTGGTATRALGPALMTCLALTWLNPHVYLDTVILVGSIAATFPEPSVFGVGAVVASFVFFFSLGYGARLLAPLFERPRSWQVLDAVIALVMWAIALKLVL
ncbi:LysE/ArgO family amino acid transporter [Pseudaestuariivita atlantica]|uniref:Amino acid transporter n=1 Tax=Pseudaestuariivita atlantica TaxID=1317121 RepID=A0A0L1JLF1_9RHOB|nr:LysE/ArgO family amino acid transporter [Pseudaestuariivita atlantica]KNG92542.1 amino acid transporter [Pseudaestuariivita atlantica]